MIDTNALLISALALITNFTNIVNVPPDSSPRSIHELSILKLNGPHAETDVWLRDAYGNKFHIQGGVVKRFTSKDSVSDSGAKKAPSGDSTLQTISSNEALTIASNQLQRLIKSGRPLDNTTVRIAASRSDESFDPPVFHISWLKTVEPIGLSRIAAMEIDGKTGCVLDLRLSGEGFLDPVNEASMRVDVHVSDPNTNVVRKKTYAWEHPEKEQVVEALRNWAAFCRLFGIDTQSQTNVLEVDWDNTVLGKDVQASDSENVCYVCFTNGATFSIYHRAPYCFSTPDVCYNRNFQERNREDWKAFNGTVKLKWEDVAASFEKHLMRLFELSHHSLPKTKKHACYWTPDVNRQGLVRTVIEYDKEKTTASDDGSQHEPLFYFECDLETGQIKSMTICNRELIQSLSESMLVAIKVLDN